MRGMALVNLGWAVVCPYRADFSDDDEVQKLVENWPNICFCNRISKVADVASSVFIGGVGDGLVVKQQYDIDAAANARNTSFPLVPAVESEVHYSRVNFGGECCSRLREVYRTSFLLSDREIIVVSMVPFFQHFSFRCLNRT